jgi:hypothetical protein
MKTLLEAMDDGNLFAAWFRRGDWTAWRAFIAALFGLPLSAEQLDIYKQCTGRQAPPTETAKEAWLVIGRRGGKSFILALVAVYLACFKEWRQYLAPGERGTVMVVAADRAQARVILRYVSGLLSGVPMLRAMVQAERSDGFDLSNSVTIEVGTSSYRAIRGYSIIAALCDEIAFWRTDDASVHVDAEVINALRPGLSTIPGSVMLCASSPYARRGALWAAWRKHYGQPSPVLVWQAPTRVMNPAVPQRVVDAAMEDDPARGQAEYLGQFRVDVESFVARDAVEACVGSYREIPPSLGARYFAFCDPSGGSGDSFTLAIGHRIDDVAVVDCVREAKPPFSPESVVDEYADVLKTYRVAKVQGDRYAGEWPREQFRKRDIEYTTAAKAKSDLYRDFLPLVNSRRIELPDDIRLINQIVGLERRTARGGRDTVDHAPGAHDDLANVVAGLAASLCGKRGYDSSLNWVNGDADATSNADYWRRQQLMNHIRVRRL